MLRYSLIGLFLVVAFEALCSLVLAKYSPAAHTWAVNITVVVLLAAACAATTPSKVRRFAAAFAVVGWLYFLTLSTFMYRPDQFRVPNRVREKLVSSVVIDWMYSLIHAKNDPSYRFYEVPEVDLPEYGRAGFTFADGTSVQWDTDSHMYRTDTGEMVLPYEVFEDIAQLVLMLHLAIGAGLIAVGVERLAERKRRAAPTCADGVSFARQS